MVGAECFAGEVGSENRCKRQGVLRREKPGGKPVREAAAKIKMTFGVIQKK